MNTDKTTITASVSQKYTLNDCGCYVDGARGIYAIAYIVEIAVSHGWQTPATSDEIQEFPDEIEEECDAFMNAQYAVEGAYWGRSEQGDWGLWEIDDYEQHKFN